MKTRTLKGIAAILLVVAMATIQQVVTMRHVRAFWVDHDITHAWLFMPYLGICLICFIAVLKIAKD